MREHGIWDELMSKATTTLSASEAPASDAPISGTSANEAPSSEMPTEKDLDLFHKLWHEDKFELDIEFSGNKVQGVTCYVIFAMPDGTGEMQVVEDGKSRRNAKKSAFLLLISNLKQANIWKLLVGDSDGNQANLTMDSDLAYMVRSGKNDLLHARSLFKDFKILQPNQARRRNQTDDQVDHKYRTERSEHLSKALSDLRHSTDPTVVALRSATSRLPVNEHREQVLNLIKNNTYSLIVGETGSGKSTQVPQLILNDAIEQNCGGECNVLCIQPRRVAARMLAQRVANERKERIGQSVGYMIRFDLQRPAKGGAITYCTTGLALSLLQKSPELLNSFSHIILDEVHVRDIDIDFVMLLVKDHITKCLKSDTPAPKIVVMSATVDVNLFSSYFKNTCADGTLEPAPHITIPGRQHHVKSTYLDELLETLSTSFSEQDLSKLLGEPMTAKYLLQHQEKFGETKKDTTGTPASFIEKPSKETISPQTTPRPLPFDEDPLMPFGLICATILNIVSTTENGSVLVFLPGLSHILGVESHLQNFGLPLGFSFADDDQFRILKLHSSLPEEMAKLSDEIPSGCRRVILATEVAEASLTIPDVKYVIDSGKVHQVIYDSTSGSHRTACCWASQSSSVQRSGRAGRVQEGSYFFLGTKKRYDSLRITKSAEILRSDLQATCLRSRMADSDAPITGFLQRAIEPPDNDEVSAAVDSLKQLQALNHKERLTNLGFLMAKLTVISPAFARLVILGVIFRCLDPLLILAALGEEPRLFYQPLNHELRKRVWLHQVSFAGQSCSDHVSHINAFKAVRKTWREEGMRQAWNYCFEHDIYIPAYREAFITASQVLRQLRDARAISTRRVEDDGDEEDLQFGGAKLNTNSHHMPLVNALLQSCLYPRLAAPGLALNKYFITQNQNRALLFSRSMAMDGKRPPRSLLAYSRKVDFASTLFLKDASRISPLAASLFGKNLASKSSGVVVDSWLGIGVSMSDDSMAEAEVLDDLVGLNWALDKVNAI
ncbi:hypothetical protein N7462_006315 [Penicillium macrosclerotiorum]|uniref:uncharacterized protein n=1 Tax=Penicillium macrosclerotiorum TaxID=303699 RepID=UPI0025467704|nr:uncharacterized protein N7462_006315 [Penicillium macrosclerotiorum]KAJ5683150.1 hypothetical protein N7462_006315 [Penicillium macrosclerotiorum]